MNGLRYCRISRGMSLKDRSGWIGSGLASGVVGEVDVLLEEDVGDISMLMEISWRFV